jgi:hypothetical protein
MGEVLDDFFRSCIVTRYQGYYPWSLERVEINWISWVGVIVSKLSAIQVAGLTGDIPQNINFAIKASVARNILEANGVPYSVAPSEMEVAIPDIGEQAGDYTLALYCMK